VHLAQQKVRLRPVADDALKQLAASPCAVWVDADDVGVVVPEGDEKQFPRPAHEPTARIVTEVKVVKAV
jgi:hypothetical protein